MAGFFILFLFFYVSTISFEEPNAGFTPFFLYGLGHDTLTSQIQNIRSVYEHAYIRTCNSFSLVSDQIFPSFPYSCNQLINICPSKPFFFTLVF